MQQKYYQINYSDTVALALEDLKEGEHILYGTSGISIKNNIPWGHKFALKDIPNGTDILKYGSPIGKATRGISKGEWVHSHNMRTNLSGLSEYQYKPSIKTCPAVKNTQKTFSGYLRKNGDVGIRNEIWIISVTGCVNRTVKIMEENANLLPGIKSIDGIFSYGHPYGCSQLGKDLERSRKMLAALITHPNAGSVLVVGLGCENITIDSLKKTIGNFNPERIKFLLTQDCVDEIKEGNAILKKLLAVCSGDKRSNVSLSRLRIGLKCGGSDSFSGITANPLVGTVSDIFVAKGASTILTEVPEMFGAEQILFNRCVTEKVYGKAVSMINNFKNYFLFHDHVVHGNPSPGNIEGGITTLEEKSLGCVQKGGVSSIADALTIGDQPCKKGLHLLDGPGNDPVSVSILAASHVHLILFTTGRGTPYGGPVPTLKISSNTRLAERKPNWTDFDAGRLLADYNIEECAAKLFLLSVQIASGKIKTANEQNGYREYHLFKTGITL